MGNIITLPLSSQLTNGTVADAVQVMADLNAISNSVNLNAAPLALTPSLIGLAAQNGASLVGFQSSGAQTVLTNSQSKMRETVSVFDYMTTAQIADVRGSTQLLDVTTAISNALSDATVNSLYFPAGYYLVNGSAAQVFSLTRGITMRGDGLFSTFIVMGSVASPLPITTDLFNLTGNIRGMSITDMAFVRPGVVATGRDIIKIDVSTVGNHFYGGQIRRCYFDPTAGSSIHVYNVTNPDGFYTSLIAENMIYGGINLEKSGDSISIVHNKIGSASTVPNANPGIRLTTIIGAMRTFISENNITVTNGSMVLTNADQVSILNNQLECLIAGGTAATLVSVTGGNNLIVEGNNFDNNGYILGCLDIDATTKAVINKNAMHTSTGGSHIKIGTTAKLTYVGHENIARFNGGANVVANLIILDTSAALDNLALGRFAMEAVTTGASNVAIGQNALYANQSGTGNVAVGSGTLINTVSTSNNTAIGTGVLKGATSGGNNTGLGYNALLACSIGTGSTALGVNSCLSMVDGYNNVAAGSGSMQANVSGNNNTALGVSSLAAGTGIQNTAVGSSASASTTTGNNNVCIGYLSGTDAVAVLTTQSNYVVLGNNLTTNANIKVAWTVTSDQRDKTDIAPINYGLDFVMGMIPKSYKLMDRETGIATTGTRYGFLAQDILAQESDSPVIVDNSDEENLKLRESLIIPILVRAIQELAAEVALLKGA